MSKIQNFPTVPLPELTLKGITPQTDPLRPVVLVVDDEAVIADTLAVILSQHGFATMVAYDGKSALQIAELVPPDLLLTDVIMPDISGVDLAIALRRLLPGCKVLLFSGQASTVDQLAAAGDSASDFTVLSKPIHPRQLLAQVSNALESRGPTHHSQFIEWEPYEELSAKRYLRPGTLTS